MSELNEVEARFFESGGQDVAPSLTAESSAPEVQSEETTHAGAAPETKANAADRESREGRFVPLQALQEERAEKKQLRDELRQYREWQAQLAQRLQQMPAAAQREMPDPQSKPLEYINHVLGNMQASTAELQQWRAQQESTARQHAAEQQALDWADEQGRHFAESEPQYEDAFEFARNSRDKELKAMGYNAAQRAAILRTNRLEIVRNAMQQEKNPAELIWDYARARGFMPKARAGDADATAKIAAGLQAAGGKLNKGGASGEGELSAKDLSNISDPEEFEKAWRRVFGKRR